MVIATPTPTSMPPLLGKWLWYGLESFDHDTWEKACTQAAAQGFAGVHPKVADRTNIWYSSAQLTMMVEVAKKHNLKVVPYHYVYGGASLDREAEITAFIGNIFGAVIPDMEREWEKQEGWMARYGDIIRNRFHYKGLLIPTTFANIAANEHPIPMMAMSKWADAWMPQVYWCMWTTSHGVPFTAQDAIDFLFPQWSTLNQQLHDTHTPIHPILPIISLGDSTPITLAGEVEYWLEKMAVYGYCGFWHAGTVGHYVDVIKKHPVPPLVKVTEPTPPKPVAAPITPVVPTKPPITLPVVTFPNQLPPQELREEQLRAMWRLFVPTLTWTPSHGIPTRWIMLIRAHDKIGHPLHEEASVTIDGRTYVYVTFSSGTIIYYDPEFGTVFECFYNRDPSAAIPKASPTLTIPARPTATATIS